MRRVMLLLLPLAGCSLYFDSHHGIEDDIDAGPPMYTPLPDAAGPVAMVRCEDGTLREVHVDEYAVDLPTHGAGDIVGQCGGGCTSAAYACLGGDCDGAYDALCTAPASTGQACALAGTACTIGGGSEPISCPQSTTCGEAVPGGTCTCDDSTGAYACAPGTGVASLQQQLVGKWQGTVTTPFAAPYAVSVWIYPDGSYWAECDPDTGDHGCTAFYYGGDGPTPQRKLAVLATSDAQGAYANIAIDFATASPNIGAIQSLTVSDTALQFTFFASWNGCNQPIVFSLTRTSSGV